MAVQPSPQLSLALDSSAEGGFLKFFRSLPEKPPTTVRLFDRNDYYTVHGDDALLASKDLYHTSSVIKYLGSGDNKLASVTLSKPNFEKFVRHLLLVKQYRVEVLTTRAKGSNDWRVAYKASPGNLQQLEDILFTNTDIASSTCIMAVKLTNENGQRLLGVAYTEPSLHKMGVMEVIENDLFSNLEALLVQLSPKECLLVAHDMSSEATKLRQTLLRSNVLITERKKSEFSDKDIVQDLNRLLNLETGATSASLPQSDLHHAMSSLAALIKYLELLSTEANFGVYSLVTFDLSQYLCLDAAAARALNLDPQPGEAGTMCLSGLLNRCSTAQGQRLLRQWIKQPLLDRNQIVERQDLVEVILSDVELRQNLRDQLKCLPDLFRLSRKFQRRNATLQDCVRVYQAIQRLPQLTVALQSCSGEHQELVDSVFTQPLKDLSGDFSKYGDLVETTVDLSLVEHHEFVIKPSFDEGLTQLRSELDEIEVKVNSLFRKVAKELGLETQKTIKLESNAQLGYFLRVTKKVEKCLRGQRRFTILETRNDGVRFTSSSLRSFSEEHLTLKEQYNTTQQRLVEEVIHIASGYTEPMQTLSDIIARLDVIASFAHVSATAPLPYVRPTVTERGEGDIILEGSRHPCVEVQDGVCFMANDVSLVRGKDMFQIITGPNMGGKSTYIRQIGVIVLMAQIGCFVPCRSATISIVDRILARVGAGDSQMKGVSTFMAEMLETASILKSATKDSLIIIDELGRGTSTYDGFGLAWAISEHIAKEICCFCLFATHFHELTALADEVAIVTNRHVTALTTNDTLTLLYRVKPGVCDQSFGIHVAELAQFPTRVIEYAKEKAAELEVFPVATEGDDSDEPSAKRRKCAVAEGEQLIEEFLSRVRQLLQEEQVSGEELQKELQKMKEEVVATNNSYILGILGKDSC